MTKLKDILLNIFDNTKQGIRYKKKYNLSQYDIEILKDIIFERRNKFYLDFNILPLLDFCHIDYEIDENNINFYIKNV